MLDIYTGKSAHEKIQKEGFKQELFSSFLGASGGPKWFCLFELDKYLFSDFFQNRSSELNLIGSSAGAFRSACFAQKDPVSAITRMAESYSETVYSDKAKPNEITKKARELLDYMLGKDGVTEVINNPVFKAHFLVNKSNGLVSSENKLIQAIGLVKSMGLNSQLSLDSFYLFTGQRRLIFHCLLHISYACQRQHNGQVRSAKNLSVLIVAVAVPY